MSLLRIYSSGMIYLVCEMACYQIPRLLEDRLRVDPTLLAHTMEDSGEESCSDDGLDERLSGKSEDEGDQSDEKNSSVGRPKNETAEERRVRISVFWKHC